MENNYLKGDLPFRSSAANSIFRFAPQRPEPLPPANNALSPAVVPSVIAGAILIILATIISVAFWQKRKKERLRAQQAAAAMTSDLEKYSDTSIGSADLTENEDGQSEGVIRVIAVGPAIGTEQPSPEHIVQQPTEIINAETTPDQIKESEQ